MKKIIKRVIVTALATVSIAMNCIFGFIIYASLKSEANMKTFCNSEIAQKASVTTLKENGQLMLLLNRDGKEIKINILEAAKNKLAFDILSGFSAHEKHIKN
jgi:hypothetical protein